MKSSRSCDAQALVRYLDDALDLRERNTVRDHLEGCEACRAELAQLRSVLAAADLSSPPTVGNPFQTEAMIHRVRRAIRERREGSWRRTWSTTLASGMAGATALLVVLIGTGQLSMPETGFERSSSAALPRAQIQSAYVGQPDAVDAEPALAGDLEAAWAWEDESWDGEQSDGGLAADIDEYLMSTASDEELLSEMESLVLEEELVALLVNY